MSVLKSLPSVRTAQYTSSPGKSSASKSLYWIILVLFAILISTACSRIASPTPLSSPNPSVTFPPTTQTTSPKSTSTPTAVPDPKNTVIWIQDRLPAAVSSALSELNTNNITSNSEAADLKVVISNQEPIGTWYYALVAPFPSLQTNINLIDLKDFWLGNYNNQSGIIYSSSETADLFNSIWGVRSSETVMVVSEDQLLTKTWADPNNFAIIPLDQLQPLWKLISINGISPLESGSLTEYPLAVNFSFENKPLSSNAFFSEPIVNFAPDELTRVAMTGVTALVRDTAAIMEDKGVLYPGEDVREILRGADLTHVSNEVPFAEDCPTPDPNQESLFFCSSDRYLQLLEDIGTDIVELSGDHFGDWGADAMIHTLQLYEEQGWLTYGGGATYEQGIQPVFITHNGNKLAFIGCNGKSHDRYATASETNPGASRCDFSWMIPKIAELSNQGYLVIATMQHEEIDSYSPVALQVFDFGSLADAGAKIVSGSQAHHPQGFDLSPSSFIHYGLGNLFFDQWYLAKYNPEQHQNKDKGFIDIHTFYRGRHVNTELIPIQFIDNAKPRPMTSDEAESFLLDVFNSSSWDLP
jgi:poly-gamma-glutamate synthesis protein (capsule biosynthesis protein)